MTTTIERALENIVNEKMTDPNWVQLIANYLKKMKEGFYPQWEIDVFCQNFFPSFSIYDAYAFAYLHTWLSLGQIVVARVVVDGPPRSDILIDENNKILENVGWGFKAIFWGGTQDEDGYFEVQTPIIADITTIDNKRIEKEISGHFPLEVGYQSAGKSMIYLNSPLERLARWPYGYDEIYLMKRISGRENLSLPYYGRSPRQLSFL
jgi:hypothetical protein